MIELAELRPLPFIIVKKQSTRESSSNRFEWSSRRFFFVKLNKVDEGCVADIAYKIESNNPANSATDCIALSMIELAELRAQEYYEWVVIYSED